MYIIIIIIIIILKRCEYKNATAYCQCYQPEILTRDHPNETKNAKKTLVLILLKYLTGFSLNSGGISGNNVIVETMSRGIPLKRKYEADSYLQEKHGLDINS